MKRMTLILGGARSGKSTYALTLAEKYKKVAFIATSLGLDREMRQRIKLHKESRPKHWTTFEEHKDLSKILIGINGKFDCVIIDCMTLLVSNLILSGFTQEMILENINRFLSTCSKSKANLIIVSNEVGLGLVPTNKLGRNFRDVAGRINQITAKHANKVYFMVAGLPLEIKRKGK